MKKVFIKYERYKNAKTLAKVLRDLGHRIRTIDVLNALASCEMMLKKYGGYDFRLAEFSVTPISRPEDPRKAEVDALQEKVDLLTEELAVARASKEDLFLALSGKITELEGRLARIDPSAGPPGDDRNVVFHIIPELSVGQLWKRRETEDTYRIIDVDMETSPSWRKIVEFVFEAKQ